MMKQITQPHSLQRWALTALVATVPTSWRCPHRFKAVWGSLPCLLKTWLLDAAFDLFDTEEDAPVLLNLVLAQGYFFS